MSNVVRTDIDALNAVLTVHIPKEDYLQIVKKDVKQYTHRAGMKGFRPGKTPVKLVQNLYGAEFLMEAINKTLTTTLNDYLITEKPNIFGQPIASEEQPDFKIDLKNPQDVEMRFDIAFLPKFDLKGVDNETYERYSVQIDPQRITSEIENRRTQGSETKEITTNIEDNDMIYLHAKEINGTLVKEDLVLSMNWLHDEIKDVFKTQRVGDQLTVNVFQLEKETTPEYVRKYFFGIEETDNRHMNENFDVKITKVTRVVPAQLDEEFFQKNFGVATEEEARTQLNTTLGGDYDNQTNSLLLRDIQIRLLAENPMALPDAFLKRWLKQQNEKNSEENIEKGYTSFADNMRWTLIRTEIAKTSGVEVDDEDLKDFYRERIQGYLGSMAVDELFIESLVQRAMQDEKQVSELYEEVVIQKTFDAIKSRVNIVEKPVSSDEFDSIMAAARAEAAIQRGKATEEYVDATEEMIEEEA